MLKYESLRKLNVDANEDGDDDDVSSYNKERRQLYKSLSREAVSSSSLILQEVSQYLGIHITINHIIINTNISTEKLLQESSKNKKILKNVIIISKKIDDTDDDDDKYKFEALRYVLEVEKKLKRCIEKRIHQSNRIDIIRDAIMKHTISDDSNGIMSILIEIRDLDYSVKVVEKDIIRMCQQITTK
jgi:hypothetical protein